MNKKIICCLVGLLLFLNLDSNAQNNAKSQINQLLSMQVKAWNNGDIEGFMTGYWQSDSLKFIGKNGLTYGWDKTLLNYKKSYKTVEEMGILAFDVLSVDVLDRSNAFVVGRWQLTRASELGDLKGYFTLLVKKIDKKWVIVADHSS